MVPVLIDENPRGVRAYYLSTNLFAGLGGLNASRIRMMIS